MTMGDGSRLLFFVGLFADLCCERSDRQQGYLM